MSAGIDAIRAAARPGDPNASAVRVLCDGVERLSAENLALAAALLDIAEGECARMDDHLCHEVWPRDADEGGHTRVAEVAWSAWRMGVLG